MTTIAEKVAQLAALPVHTFTITCNEHRLVYEDARDYIGYSLPLDGVDWDADIWSVAVYPRTPVVSLLTSGNDLGALLDEVIAELQADAAGPGVDIPPCPACGRRHPGPPSEVCDR